jgi:hypothetical protein
VLSHNPAAAAVVLQLSRRGQCAAKEGIELPAHGETDLGLQVLAH